MRLNKFFNRVNQNRLIFYAIGFLILITILGYLLADYSWDNVMDTLTATEIPSPSPAPTSNTASPKRSHPSEFSDYEFPDSIEPAKQYLFYLHGKIIEDQGIPALSPDFGEYEYEAILERLNGYGFVVISEQRPKNTDGVNYARKVAEQITALLDAGVPAKNITVIGASKGAGITIFVSHFLENEEINFVIMAICHHGDLSSRRS